MSLGQVDSARPGNKIIHKINNRPFGYLTSERFVVILVSMSTELRTTDKEKVESEFRRLDNIMSQLAVLDVRAQICALDIIDAIKNADMTYDEALDYISEEPLAPNTTNLIIKYMNLSPSVLASVRTKANKLLQEMLA